LSETFPVGIPELAAQLIAQITEQVRRSFAAPVPRTDGIQPRLLTAQEAGEYIGRSEQAVRHLIHQRDIPVVRKGRSVRIDRKDLDRWIENNKS
jgi:excisionase family DNA binding protein